MGNLATTWVEVEPTTRRFAPILRRQMRQINVEPAGKEVGDRLSKGMATGFKGLAAGLTATIGAMVSAKALAGLNSLAQSASNMNETVSKTQNIFGNSTSAIMKFASTAATSLGMSKQAALEGTAQFGNFFNQIGIGTKESVKMSKGLVTLSADLGSFNNADPSKVMEAFQSATRGEYDSLQQFIPTVNAAAIQTEALRQTHKKSAQDLTNAEKATALYTIAQRDAGKAQGDFARTGGGLANQQRALAAQFANLKATLGTALLPVFTHFVQILNQLMPQFQALAERYAPLLAKELDKLTPKINLLVLGLSAMIAAFREGDVTSDGFVGQMEKIGVALSHAKVSLSSFSTGSGETGTQLRSLADSAQKLAPVIERFLQSMPSLGDALKVAAVGMKFLADNTKLLQQLMPVIVGGVIAYKAAQLAANVAQAVALPTKIAEVVVNRQLVKSNRELIASRVQLTASVITGTVAETGATAAKEIGTLATIRSKVAMVVANIATKVWAVSIKLLGIAIKIASGPIGIAIAVIAALVAVVIYAYKHNEKFRTIVQKAWADIQKAVSYAWNNVLKPLFNLIIAYYKMMWNIALAAARVVVDAWNRIYRGAQESWRIVKSLFDRFMAGNRALAQGFRNAADAIGAAFGRLREAAKRPVNFIIGTVYDRGIRGFWGKIRGALGIKGYDLPYIPTLAAGGKFSQPTAIVGEGNTSRPEYVIPTDPRHRSRALGLFEELGGQLMAGGGILGWLTDPLGNFRKAAAGPLGALRNMAGGPFGEMLATLPKMVIAALQRKVKDWMTSAGGAIGGGALGGMGVATMMKVLHTAFPGLPLISGYRPGAITATGNRSYHASGRAVDLPPRMDVFNWIRSHFGRNSKELIFSQASPANLQIHNGQPHVYTGITRQMHFNHVHWAYRNGGLINEPIFGVGRSGRTYSFGEGGVETVIPGRAGGGGVTLVNHGVITTHDVEDWFSTVARNVKRRRPGVL